MSSTSATVLRRVLALATGLGTLGAATVLLAGPAGADVPVGWSPNAEPVNVLHAVLILGGIPLALFIMIAVLVYTPSLMRGERVAPGAPAMDNQWIGGPRRSVAELAGPDTADSAAGGASARW